MRISGGSAKGVKLRVPAGARPASERVRQAIFSSLGSEVPGARVLDLYCGSGAYGLEALSRGASSAVFVDSDERAVEACLSNAKAAGLATAAKVRRAAVDRYLKRAGREGPFDLVFVDPPYASREHGDRLLEALSPLVAEGGRVVLETRWSDLPATPAERLVVEDDRRYGDTRILVFQRVGAR